MRAAAQAEPDFPVLTSRITDQAGLLSADDYTAIQAELAALEQKSTDQVAVVTLKSLEGYPIEDYGYQLGRKWGIGQKGKNNGILLIVAPNERKVRIEVGRGLEPVMTDAMSSLIIQNAILPEFRRGNFSAGIRAGVRDIKDVLLGDAEEVEGARKRQRRATPSTSGRSCSSSSGSASSCSCCSPSCSRSAMRRKRSADAAGRSGGPVVVPAARGAGAAAGRAAAAAVAADGPAAAATSAAADRRGAGEDGERENRMRLFSAEDERRISEAITDAERQTSGEIVVVVAAQSDGYHYVPPLVGAHRRAARALGADLFHPDRRCVRST